MKKIILISILCCILGVTVSGQDYWEIIDVPDTIQIKSMATNNQNHIFLGTGGNNMFGGIYRSVDNCNTWEYLKFAYLGVYKIYVNEYNHLFTGWIGDMYKSIDNGDNWSLKFSGISNICCIKSYPNGLMFANSGTPTYMNIMRSLDYGDNWEEVMIFFGNVEEPNDIAILNQDTIYAGTTNWFDGGGVYRSIDGGDSWDHIGMYNFHVLSLELNSQGDLFVGTYGHNTQYWLSGVYVLYNGDDEFTQLYSTLVNDMTINSDDDLYVATDYGVLESLDNGQTFNYINDGLFTGNVDDLAIDSAGYLYASSYNPCNMARSIEPTITGINKIQKPDFELSAFPNPFSDKTTIKFELPINYENTVLKIYNITGKPIRQFNITGKKSQQWDGRDNNGNLVKKGIYFYNINYGNISSKLNKILFIN